jgi:hypothetical protein
MNNSATQGLPVVPGGAPQIVYQQVQDQIHPALASAIQSLVKKGWRVIQQTNTSASLVKPKKFSFFWAFMWFLVAGFGLVVYLIYYAAKRDENLYIQVINDSVKYSKGK